MKVKRNAKNMLAYFPYCRGVLPRRILFYPQTMRHEAVDCVAALKNLQFNAKRQADEFV